MLFHSGLPMGRIEDFLKANPNNEKGFYEHKTFVALNRRLVPSTWPDKLTEEVESNLGVEMNKAPHGIMVKDPRFCLTLRYWRHYRSIDKIIVVLRKPTECVASLTKRGDKADKPFEWYYSFYLSSLCIELEDRDWCALSYDEMIEEPSSALSRIEQYLERPLNVKEGLAFVDLRLRHQYSNRSCPWPEPARRLLDSPF